MRITDKELREIVKETPRDMIIHKVASELLIMRKVARKDLSWKAWEEAKASVAALGETHE